MKPSLQLNLAQQLTLTPQLQQAIRLLQLSTLDLQQEIQQFIESNPMLESVSQEDKNESAEELTNHQSEFSEFQWTSPSYSKGTSFDDPDFNYENFYSTTTNLQDHLRWR